MVDNGGITVAKALDEVAEVVLVEPRDAFVHNVAALRGLVDPAWTDRMFFPYDRLLDRGRVLRDRAVRVDSGTVALGSGQRIDADYLVLATGSAYPFPAKIDVADSVAAKAKMHAGRAALARTDHVLLLGAGPVGIELAGEIKAAWPDKAVTIVDPAEDIVMGGFPDEFRAALHVQLDELGVDVLLGTALRDEPPSAPGEFGAFTVATESGRKITADLWFRCYGVVPVAGYLAGDLVAARRPSGHLEVTADLRLPGQERVFAIGDVTAIPETKLAKAAGDHAQIVATNIRTLIAGGGELATYQPEPPGISLPLGPTGGASYRSDVGVLGAEQTSRLKGANLRIDSFTDMFRMGR